MSQPRPSSRDEYQIAILCALPLEYNAVSAIFDCFWDEQGDNFGRVPGDPNCYTTGCIGRYNVVLALISRIGKAYAASAAASLRSSYGGLKLVLLVGVCGGMPYNQFGEEILLGDVVISKSVAQHDLGRKYPNSFVMKDAAGDGLRTSNKLVRNLIALFETDRGLELLETRTSRFLKELQAKTAGRRHRAKYAYPGAVEDKLFESTYRHRHRLSPACICKSCHGDSDPVCPDAISTPCSDLGCDDVHLVSRERLNAGTGRSLDAMYQPAVHLGCFASGDTVMKSATDRDAVSRKTGAIAFEMEGAGVWDEFDCTIIIKGVCDYADSHKSKSWQGFAAATAAAASKAVLDGYMQTDAPPKTSMNGKCWFEIPKSQTLSHSEIMSSFSVDHLSRLQEKLDEGFARAVSVRGARRRPQQAGGYGRISTRKALSKVGCRALGLEWNW